MGLYFLSVFTPTGLESCIMHHCAVAIIERLYGSGKDVLGKIVFVLRDKGQYHSPWRPVASREQDGIAPNPSGLSLYSPIHPYQSHSILSMMAIVQDQKCSN